MRIAALVLFGLWVLLCVVARLAYPRLLFPARKLDAAMRAPRGAERVSFAHADGSTTDALHFPAPAGARTVVLFHGNGETMFDQEYYADELTRRGLGVLAVEYRGYGTTYGAPPSEASLYADGEAAIGWLTRERSIPNERIALWGYSLGSAVAAEMAFRGHGARIVLFAPFTSMPAMGRRIVPFLPVRLLMSHELDTLRKAPKIAQPAIVVHGELDPLIPIAMGEAVTAALRRARLIRVEGAQHAGLVIWGDAKGRFDVLARHLSEE